MACKFGNEKEIVELMIQNSRLNGKSIDYLLQSDSVCKFIETLDRILPSVKGLNYSVKDTGILKKVVVHNKMGILSYILQKDIDGNFHYLVSSLFIGDGIFVSKYNLDLKKLNKEATNHLENNNMLGYYEKIEKILAKKEDLFNLSKNVME